MGNQAGKGQLPVVLLCGGMGSRMGMSANHAPKPLLPVGGRPIVWHVMDHYAHFGFNRFILALGWRGQEIKSYFMHQQAEDTDLTMSAAGSGAPIVSPLRGERQEDWEVTCLDTGLSCATGTRIRRVLSMIQDPGTFLVSYADTLADVDLGSLLDLHRSAGRLATLTSVRPPSRFGELEIEGNRVTSFREKFEHSTVPINAGYMAFETSAIPAYFCRQEDMDLSSDILTALAADGELSAHHHSGFWRPMDTPEEWKALNELWNSGSAPWRVGR